MTGVSSGLLALVARPALSRCQGYGARATNMAPYDATG